MVFWDKEKMTKKMNRADKAMLIAVIVIAVLAIGHFATRQGFKPFAIESTTLFVKPLWARLECAPTDTPEGIQNFNEFQKTTDFLGREYYRITCGIDENTDKCDVYSSGGKLGVGLFNWCEDNNINYKCDSSESERTADSISNVQFLFSMNKGNKLMLWCETHLGININCKSLRKEYRPWKLFRYVGGSKFEAKANTCKLNDVSGISSLIPIQQNTPVNELTMTGGDGLKWVNFVHDWAYGPGTNIFKYQGKDVYCTGNAIYNIQNMQMKDGKLVQINPEYNPPNNLPFQIQTIGSKIKNVQCCSNEPNCDDNFNIIPDKPKQNCFSDAQCQNAGNPIPTDSKTVIEQKCQSGVCVWQQSRQVQCTQDLACQYPNVCNKLTYTCEKPNPGGYCGDNTCNRDETKISCPSDCGSNVKPFCKSCFGWLWNKMTGNKYCTPQPSKKVLGFIPIPLTSQNSICPLFLLIMLLLLIVFGVVGYNLYKKNKKKGKKRKR